MLITLLIFVIAMILSLLIYKAYQNTKEVMINTICLHASNKNNAKPLKILHLSDIHLENISVSPEQLYSIISNQPIDIIALTGDFLDRKRSIPKLVPYLEVLKKIQPTYGIYAVFGNHDYFLRKKHFQQLKETLTHHGIIVLQNEHYSININGMTMNIIGIDDYSSQRSDIVKSIEGLSEGYQLIITHDPNIVLDMNGFQYDYLLSGHFHGGQIHWPKPYHLIKMGKLVRKNMVKGLHYYNGIPFYISEGLGQTGINLRVGSRPEVTIHEITI